jgi:hypothetical protein
MIDYIIGTPVAGVLGTKMNLTCPKFCHFFLRWCRNKYKKNIIDLRMKNDEFKLITIESFEVVEE